MGVGGFLLILGAILIFQLSDRDNRNGWLWAGGYVALAMVLSNLTPLRGMGIYLAFLAAFVALIWTKSIARK